MPVFYMLIMDLNQEGFKKLETLCRVFLWGKTPEGNNKVPLVALEHITCSKSDGGLSILNSGSNLAFSSSDTSPAS
jgi:hypothetical protein